MDPSQVDTYVRITPINKNVTNSTSSVKPKEYDRKTNGNVEFMASTLDTRAEKSMIITKENNFFQLENNCVSFALLQVRNKSNVETNGDSVHFNLDHSGFEVNSDVVCCNKTSDNFNTDFVLNPEYDNTVVHLDEGETTSDTENVTEDQFFTTTFANHDTNLPLSLKHN